MSILVELTEIYREDGTLHAHDIRDYAYENPDSDIGRRLKVGDDSAAAHEWRLQEARNIVRIYVRQEDDAKYRGTISLTVDRTNGGGYRPIVDVMRNDTLRLHAYMDALKDFERVIARYAYLVEFGSQFSGVIAEISRARTNLEAQYNRVQDELAREEARQKRDKEPPGDGDRPPAPPP